MCVRRLMRLAKGAIPSRAALLGLSLLVGLTEYSIQAVNVRDVVINEVAWMGTQASFNDEWIELYNNTDQAINLMNWTLTDGGDINITLSGTIPAKGFFLLERTADTTVSDIPADQIYTGSLVNTGEILTLKDNLGNTIDTANGDGGAWPAGNNTTKSTMERLDPLAPDTDGNWVTNDGLKRNGLDAGVSPNPPSPINGTPKTQNSPITRPPTVSLTNPTAASPRFAKQAASFNINFTTDEDGTYVIKVNGTICGTGIAGVSTNTKSCALPGVFAEGIKNLTVEVTDAANNTGSDSESGAVRVDNTAPTDPTNIHSTSHTVNTASNDNTIHMAWNSDAGDPVVNSVSSGVDGFSVGFDTNSANTCPDTVKDLEETATSFTSAALPDGSYFFHLCTLDNAGNHTATVTVGPFIIDTTPPDTSITSQPANPSNSSTATFAFTSTEAGSSFQCKLDAGAFESCTSPKSYTSLTDGSHTFQVKAIDPAGNADPTPASFIWTVISQLGTIIITKDAVPNDPQDFEFSRSFGANFFLDDDTDGILSNTATFTGVAAGSHTVTELGSPAGFALTNLACTDPDNQTTVNLTTRTATIDLDPGETVTCTFTNSKQGDSNFDGQINVIDARLCLQGAFGSVTLTDAQKIACDVDKDGDMDLADAQKIAQFAIGLIGSLATAGALAGLGLMWLGLPLLMLRRVKMRRPKLWVLTGLLMGVGLLLTACPGALPPPPAGTNVIVQTLEELLMVGESIEIVLSVSEMPGGGVAAIQVGPEGLRWDPAILKVRSIRGLSGFTVLASEFDNTTGRGRFSAANPAGGVANGAIAAIMVEAVGGGSSALQLVKATMVLGDASNAAITVFNTIDGQIRVGFGLP